MQYFFLIAFQDWPELPEPYELPTPGEGMLDASALWDLANLTDMIRSFRTVFALAEQNYVINAFVILGLIVLAVAWLSRFVGDREESV